MQQLSKYYVAATFPSPEDPRLDVVRQGKIAGLLLHSDNRLVYIASGTNEEDAITNIRLAIQRALQVHKLSMEGIQVGLAGPYSK